MQMSSKLWIYNAHCGLLVTQAVAHPHHSRHLESSLNTLHCPAEHTVLQRGSTMRTRSKILGSLAGATGLMLALSGCIGSAGAPAQTDAAVGGEIRVLINAGGNATWLEAAIPEFEKANPEYTVTLDVQEAAAIRERMVQLYSSTDAPDLAMAQWATPQYQTLLEADALADVSGVWQDSGLAENNTEQVIAGWTADGEQYGIPLTKTWFPVLFYNKALFEQAGITAPEGVPTEREWNDIIAKLKAAGIQPVAIAAATGQAGAMHFVNARLAAHASPDEYAKFTEPTLDPELVKSEAFRASVNDLVEWGTAGVFAEGAASAQEAQAISLFAAGGAAMVSVGVWGDGIIDSQSPAFETGWMLYPEAEEPTKFLSLNSGGLVIPNSANNVVGAKKLAEFLSGAEAQALIATSSSQTPTRTDIDADVLADALLPNTNEMRESFDSIGEVSPWIDPLVSPYLSDNLSRVLVGEITPDQFIEEFSAKLSE
ncbi:ABC transporter substrate-binding protein [Agromyces sp. NPDC058104]|uniref:ABC transporter substrate-binding protein n=1 Tax=Agromyces sp. NPDC058104 TaxID=3346342 RepID=UPI0036DC0052